MTVPVIASAPRVAIPWRTKNQRTLRYCFLTVLLAMTAGAAVAQTKDFPTRPVRVVVPVPPGGSLDVMARILAPKWGEVMGQNVIIDYRPGANTIVGSENVARAPADGYTLLINTLPFVVNPALYKKMPFDAERDFAPVSLLGSSPFVLVVHPSVPAKSVKDLVALAKAHPGKLNYSSSGSGSNLHVAAELFKNLTGTNIVHVPYGGGGPALIAILNGEASVSFLSLIAVTGHVANGRMRALGVTSSKRSRVTPNLPTIAEQGVTGYEFGAWFGIYAPAATPGPVIKTLSDSIQKALRDASVAERFDKEGADIVGGSPDELAKHVRSELALWAKVVKAAGLKID
jgi:tripartite-type tricarboxylate transporter receptor subunit TctC